MKWGLRIAGALVVAVVLLVIGVLLIPAERMAGIAADQLRRVTGREVTISGDVSMTLWPVLGLRAEGLEVGNADWAGEGPMLNATDAAIGLDAGALLGGEIRITNIEAHSPVIRLNRRADGRASWQFSDAAGAASIETETSPARAARPLAIERLEITDATLIYASEGAETVTLSGVDLAMDWPEPTGPADLRAVLRPAGQPVTVNAEIAGFDTFLTGDTQPVTISVDTGAGRAELRGEAAVDGSAVGALTVATGDTTAFLAALGIAGVTPPQGLGRSIDASAAMKLTPARDLSLRNLVAELGGNSLRGTVLIGLNGTPQVDAQLTTGALRLGGMGTAEATGGQGGGGAPAADGWSTAPIDASGLASFNGDITLSADSVELGALRLGETRTRIRNDQSRMVVALSEVAAYGGRVTGEFVMNNRAGLSVGGSLQAEGVQMNPLLTDLAGITRFDGQGDARLSFLGSGQSVAAIVGSLSGDGAIDVGRGTIEGIDLDALLGSYDVAGGTTVFDSLGATFAIEEGVLRNDDLLLLLPNFNATGAGQANLGQRTLDYTVTPKALRVNGERGLAVPVRISGPWADPRIRPDLEAAVDLNFREERRELEDRVKQKLAEELNLSAEEGQSLEDAVKNKVEDKLKERLLKLFE